MNPRREFSPADPLRSMDRGHDGFHFRPAPAHASAATSAARATVVNRTHRVVREQAMQLREQRARRRSLWVPLAIVSSLLMVICYAIWAMLDGYTLTPNGVPDASDQLVLLLLWSLPVTALLMGLAWFKRGRGRMGHRNEAQP